jgi:transcription initiation factor TFIID subunit 6
MAGNEGPKLLWNPDNVRDVADSQGITLSEEPLRVLAQDVEYRIGQLIVEALRFMRAANRTTLTVQDVSLALRVLKVEPLYGYESTRPLRYGEASLGPGQPLFYIDDEEIDFEKVINAPLPKVPRDMSFTGGWPSGAASLVRRLANPSPLGSALACRRGRPALHSAKPHDRRDLIKRPLAEGPRRESRPRSARRQRQRLVPAVGQTRDQQRIDSLLR